MRHGSVEGTEVQYRLLAQSNRYRVGDDGSAWSFYGGRWKRLKPRPNHQGRHRVAICMNCKAKSYYLARLILEAFVGPCPPGMEACHIDDDKSNNRLSNLRWGTRPENIADAQRNGRITRGTARHSAKISDADAATIRRMRAAGATVREIAQYFPVCHQHISKVCRGRSWAHVPSTEREG